MKNTLVLIAVASLSLFVGCSKPEQPRTAEQIKEPNVNQETTKSEQPRTAEQIKEPNVNQGTTKSFTVTLPDGKKITITPDMSRPDMKITTLSVLKRDCERAVHDSKQADTPFLDRTIRIHIGIRSSYRDENGNVVRYKHEPEPVFKEFKIRDLGTVEIDEKE